MEYGCALGIETECFAMPEDATEEEIEAEARGIFLNTCSFSWEEIPEDKYE